MININEKLTILHDDNGVFTDYSTECASFNRDEATFAYDFNEDFVYIGFYKPINTFYADVSKSSHSDETLTVSYYNGSSFTPVSGFYDDTTGFLRAGFVRWDRGQADEAKTTVNGTELYWYRVLVNGSVHNFTVTGLNILFSDDEDLKRVFFEYNKFLPEGQSTHVLAHEAARDEIIQQLNIMGKEKYIESTSTFKDITAFDLLDISEVKLASTYLVLSNIFMNL